MSFKASKPWSATALTLFPEIFPGPLGHSLSGKALKEGLWSLDPIQLRDFATDKHHSVDDTCFGGGAGMVLRPNVVDAALEHVKLREEVNAKNRPLIYLTPRGKTLDQSMVRRYALESSGVVLLCGRYEGVDHRVIEHWEEQGMEEVSIGDYILSGGEIAALTLLDACIRLLPGVIGKEESLTSESFELGLLEYPQYTRPQVWKDKIVPEVLLSGDHQKIAAWRQKEAVRITQIRRPDLWVRYLEQIGIKQ
jgi:tRNA (guanine37-N1)-methyltransferase